MSTTSAQQSSDQQSSDQQSSDQQSTEQQNTDLSSETIDSGINPFKKRHPEVGASPGTLVIADDALPPVIRIMSFDQQELREQQITSTEDLAHALDPGDVTWVDVQGFGDEQVLREIGEVFGIHPLAMEDVVNMPQRPKTETYGNQVLIITRMVRMEGASHVDMEQVTVVFGPNYVLTFQERYGDVLDPVRNRIRNGQGRRIRNSGSGYLSYAIVDTIVDAYYLVIEALGEHLEHLEDVVLTRPSSQSLREINRTKNMLVNLRRAIWPQREAVNSLIRDENPLISEEERVFLRDTYDHCMQTAEVIEMQREMANGLVNIYLSSIANRTNDVMKVLTIMASVFIPLTFMAGIYGMNFDHMPEVKFRYGYYVFWCAMLAVGGGMVGYFWKKGWIGSKGSGAEFRE